jgi:hypothetical protein
MAQGVVRSEASLVPLWYPGNEPVCHTPIRPSTWDGWEAVTLMHMLASRRRWCHVPCIGGYTL